MTSAAHPVYRRYSEVRHLIRDADQLFYRYVFPRWTMRLTAFTAAWCVGSILWGNVIWLSAGVVGVLFTLAYAAYSAGIGISGLSQYQHAAKVAWWAVGRQASDDTDLDSDVLLAHADHGRRLMVLETRATTGGRAVTLSSQVRKYSGLIDVYETNPGDLYPWYNRSAATLFGIGTCGSRYAWHRLILSAVPFLPLARIWLRPDDDELDEDTPDRQRVDVPRYCSWACVAADHAGGAVPLNNLSPHDTPPGIQATSCFYKYAFTLVDDRDLRANELCGPRKVAA